jgi:hypothetical protein
VAVSGNAGFGAAVVSRRESFRRWRRTCPFWGGLLLLLAGIELLLIPLSGILIHGAVRLVVYIGIGGVFSVLLGVLLIACGLLLWLNPAHRTFYAIAGVLLAVLSFIASNFGGFFIGMLLGIIGGSMGFGWTPTTDQPTRRPLDPPQHGGRLMAAAVLPLLLAGTTLVGQNAAHGTTSQQQQDCILWIVCLPSLTPSPGPTPAATQPPGPGSAPQPSTSAGSTSGSQSKSKTAAGTPGVKASTATSVIVAGSATLDGMSYQGTAQVPTASGTLTMMRFTMSSLTLTGGVRAAVTQNGQATVTSNSSLDFSGGVVLYATKLSGSLLGIPITLTPGDVVTVLLKLLNSLTPLVPVTMTNVTTDDFLVASDSLQANDLTITSG